MKYVPPFEGIKALLTFTAVKGELVVNATYEQLTTLIQTMLRDIEVDEAWYLSRYPDVAEGIAKGTVASAREHFLANGYFEGQMPFPVKVDEAWYLEQNPGVAEYIARGDLESAQKHFEDHGYREGRRPFP